MRRTYKLDDDGFGGYRGKFYLCRSGIEERYMGRMPDRIYCVISDRKVPGALVIFWDRRLLGYVPEDHDVMDLSFDKAMRLDGFAPRKLWAWIEVDA